MKYFFFNYYTNTTVLQSANFFIYNRKYLNSLTSTIRTPYDLYLYEYNLLWNMILFCYLFCAFCGYAVATTTLKDYSKYLCKVRHYILKPFLYFSFGNSSFGVFDTRKFRYSHFEHNMQIFRKKCFENKLLLRWIPLRTVVTSSPATNLISLKISKAKFFCKFC